MNTRKGSITETMLSIFSEKIELPELSKRTASAKLEQFDASFSCLKQLTLATRTSAQGFASHDKSSQHFSQCFTVITDLWNQLAAIRLIAETPSSLRTFSVVVIILLAKRCQVHGRAASLAVRSPVGSCRVQHFGASNALMRSVSQKLIALYNRNRQQCSSCLIDVMDAGNIQSTSRPPQLHRCHIMCADVRLIQMNIGLQEERDQQSDLIAKRHDTTTRRLAAAGLEEQLDLSMHQFLLV